MAVLSDRPRNFVDVHDPADTYAANLWEALTMHIFSLQLPRDYRLPSSRYACARELQGRMLPCLAGFTLGRLCHIVQLAVSQKNILGYRDGALVPYVMSKCLVKKQHAEYMMPCTPAHSATALPCADWETTRTFLKEIMDKAKRS